MEMVASRRAGGPTSHSRPTLSCSSLGVLPFPASHAPGLLLLPGEQWEECR